MHTTFLVGEIAVGSLVNLYTGNILLLTTKVPPPHGHNKWSVPKGVFSEIPSRGLDIFQNHTFDGQPQWKQRLQIPRENLMDDKAHAYNCIRKIKLK